MQYEIPRHPPRTHRTRRSSAPYYPPTYDYPPEPARTPFIAKALLVVFYGLSSLFVGYVLYSAAWPQVRAQLAAQPAPVVSVGAPAPASAPQAPPQQPAAPAVVQPPAQPVEAPPAAAPVVAEPPAAAQPANAAPPAVVNVPAPAAVVVPVATARIAIESQAQPTAAPAPTVATTKFMQIGADFTANADGTCVRTARGADLVEFCQVRPMTVGEMSSAADFLRTGRIQGTVVE